MKVGIEILRPEYTAEEKLRRYNFCLSMLEQPPEFLQSIVWIDESSVPIDPAALTYIGTKGQYTHAQIHAGTKTRGRSHTSTSSWLSAMCMAWSIWTSFPSHMNTMTRCNTM